MTPIDLTLEILERSAAERVAVRGSGSGGEYAVRFEIAFELEDRDGGTTVTWSGDVRFQGVLNSVAQRVLPGVVGEQIDLVMRAAAEPAI